jgi:hypothetical protein
MGMLPFIPAIHDDFVPVLNEMKIMKLLEKKYKIWNNGVNKGKIDSLNYIKRKLSQKKRNKTQKINDNYNL